MHCEPDETEKVRFSQVLRYLKTMIEYRNKLYISVSNYRRLVNGFFLLLFFLLLTCKHLNKTGTYFECTLSSPYHLLKTTYSTALEVSYF